MGKCRDLIVDITVAASAGMYPAGRALAHVLGIRSERYPQLVALVEAIRDQYARAEAFDSEYASGEDHWGYTVNPEEIARHRLAIELLNDARSGRRFGRAIEIGCAEGVFTEMLGPLCESLLAVDFNHIALERARERCSRISGIGFSRWDLRRDDLPGQFDLTVVMDVLTCIRRPAELRLAYKKLLNGLRPGDLLLAGDYRYDRLLEESWFGRGLLYGAKWVIEELVTHPALETVTRAETEHHVFALLRKR